MAFILSQFLTNWKSYALSTCIVQGFPYFGVYNPSVNPTMKKRIPSIVLSMLFLCTAFVQTGCFGKFALVRGLYNFNAGIGDNNLGGRFVRTLVMYGLNLTFFPAYAAAILIDLTVINVIEFWTGTNPIGMAPGEMEQQNICYEGKMYQVTATSNQFHVAQLVNGKPVSASTFRFDPKAHAWSVEQNGQSMTLFSIENMDEESWTMKIPSAEGEQCMNFCTSDLDQSMVAMDHR